MPTRRSRRMPRYFSPVNNANDMSIYLRLRIAVEAKIQADKREAYANQKPSAQLDFDRDAKLDHHMLACLFLLHHFFSGFSSVAFCNTRFVNTLISSHFYKF